MVVSKHVFEELSPPSLLPFPQNSLLHLESLQQLIQLSVSLDLQAVKSSVTL